MKKITLSREQEDYICYVIGEWYVKWKMRDLNSSIGYAKEELKHMICDPQEEYVSPIMDNEERAKDLALKIMKIITFEEVSSRVGLNALVFCACAAIVEKVGYSDHKVEHTVNEVLDSLRDNIDIMRRSYKG